MFNKHKVPYIHPHLPTLMLRSDIHHWPFVYAHGDLEEAFSLEIEASGYSDAPDLICADVPVPELEGIHIGYHKAVMVHIFIAKGASGQLGGRVCYHYDRDAWHDCLKWYERQKLLQRKTDVAKQMADASGAF